MDTSLFFDWCKATARPPTPDQATLDRFADELSLAPSTVTRLLHALNPPTPRPYETRWDSPPFGSRSSSRNRQGPSLLPLDESIARCARNGWPAGFVGRRDAWLLTLLGPKNQGGAGMSRAAALATRPGHINTLRNTVRSRPLPRHEEADRCPRCAMFRWLELVSMNHQWSRSAVRQHLALAGQGSGTGPEVGHRCEQGTPDQGQHEQWRTAWTLAPAIDQHGWPTDQAMTPRAVTTVVARRRNPNAPILRRANQPVPKTVTLVMDEETIDLRIANVSRDADEANDRIAALLDETEQVMVRVGLRTSSRGR